MRVMRVIRVMRVMREGLATTAAAMAVTALVTATGACRSEGSSPEYVPLVAELPATPNRDLDLLFVIDDSTGLIEAQQRLAASFPIVLERLGAVPGGLPNLHIGVITTDMGTKASQSSVPGPPTGQLGQGGCSGTGKAGNLQVNQAGTDLSGTFVRDVENPLGGRMVNYTGSLPTVFGKLISAGGGGCGFEQPLAAMRAALEDNPANTGFLREEAMLGVVFLADEDDCSAASTRLFDANAVGLGPLQSFRCTQFGVTCSGGGETTDAMAEAGAKSGCTASESGEIIDGVLPYRDFLLGLKQEPRRVIVGGIVGPAEPVEVELRAAPGGGAPAPALAHACSFTGATGLQVADPAPRLHALVSHFTNRGELATICGADYTDSVTRIAELLRRSMGSACVEASLADMSTAQRDCVVEDVAPTRVDEIAPCDEAVGARPCWRLEADPKACRFSPAPQLALRIDRDAPPDPAVITRMHCRDLR